MRMDMDMECEDVSMFMLDMLLLLLVALGSMVMERGVAPAAAAVVDMLLMPDMSMSMSMAGGRTGVVVGLLGVECCTGTGHGGVEWILWRALSVEGGGPHADCRFCCGRERNKDINGSKHHSTRYNVKKKKQTPLFTSTGPPRIKDVKAVENAAVETHEQVSMS